MFSDIELKELQGELVDYDPTNPETYLTFDELLEFYPPTGEFLEKYASE